jgi:Polysaccharide lyase
MAMMCRSSWVLLAALASLATSGCSDRSMWFGDHPDVTWWNDHESGDLSGWTGGVSPGGFVIPGNSSVDVVKGMARSGEYALLVTDKSPDARDYPLAARNGPLALEVYCSAWYYLPLPLHPKTYWWFMLFRSKHPPFDSQSFRDEVRLSFTTRADGTMGTSLESPDLGTVAPLVDREAPVGRWFHIETFLRTATDASGEVTVWQDGELTFHATGKTSETTYTEWMVGAVADGLTTPTAQLYIDDAAISRRRLGPLAPFTRE